MSNLVSNLSSFIPKSFRTRDDSQSQFSLWHVLSISALLFILLLSDARSQGFTEVFAGSLSGIRVGSSAWGDYDNDGDLDILLTGADTSNLSISKIFQNTGAGFTEVFAGSLDGVSEGSGLWGDYDNDGKLDILLTGVDTSGAVSKIYHNMGTGFEEVFAGSLTGMYQCSAAWGDYDNDGDLDIALLGTAATGLVGKIYENTGSGFEEVYPGSLTGGRYGSITFADFDNDGDLDILTTGYNTDAEISMIAKIYQNTGSGFTALSTPNIFGRIFSASAWGDYDNDGDLDIIITGWSFALGPISTIYQNNDGDFIEVYSGMITGVQDGSVAWGDYDNDGDLDILLTGQSLNLAAIVARIYQNTGSGFVEVLSGNLTGVRYASVAWGDYDHDGDLDILLTGADSSWVRVSKIYQNTGTVFNTPPIAPSGLTTTQSGADVTFKWNRATDAQTSSLGLTYNLRVGTSPNGINIQSPMSDTSTGYYRVARLGNANQDTAWTIKNLPVGTYYWSVQAIDNSFAGSPFAAELSFQVLEQFSLAISDNGNGTVTKSPDKTSYDDGAEVILTAIPAENYHFSGWSGDVTGDENPATIVMSGNKNITAHFAPNIVTMQVEAKWNLVSIPAKPVSPLKPVLFPTAISNAFAFEGSYIAKDTLKTGVGYWLKFDSLQNVSFTGTGSLTSDTINVLSGWNIIGSLSESISTTAITSNPPGIIASQFFGYKSGYIASDILAPGKGYWVKVNESGQLILSSDTFSRKK